MGKSAEAEPTTTDGRHADLATGATTGTETALAEALAEVLAEVVRSERVPADSHFFDDLGADSLVMAHFCARVRKRPDLPDVSIRDVYRNPTIRGLVAALKDVSPGGAAPPPVQLSEMPAPASTRLFVLCGALQFTIFVGYSYLVAVVLTHGYQWISEASGVVDIYLRSVVFSGAAFVGLCTFPVGAKWILVGRWKAGEFPLWGLAYLRFWTVKALVHANPMVFFVGNPLFVWYLRALGARVGRNVTILSRAIPVCTDLLTIGSGAVIRKETHLLCYRAHAGRIQTGPVTLGRDVFVGERSILDINTSMGDGAQLGHASALQSGESVPAGQHWHGSPAQRTDLDYVRVGPARCGTLRRAGFALGALLQVFLVYLPLAVGATYLLVALVPALGQLLDAAPTEIASGEMFGTALALSLVLFLGPLLGGLAVVFTVPRVLNLLIKPDKVYPLYGFHYGVHRAIVRLTNVKFYKKLFGDSSYIVPYLRLLGYDLSQVQQTGSNFGSELQHESPYLSTIGSGTMVCDGLSMMNAEFSNTSFRVSRVTIGPGNFLGNNIAFPAGARTGADCLLATKVLIPLDGKVREGVGLLGSPSFEIPRSVERDGRFDHLRTGDELRRNLRAKNRYNRRTMGVFLLAHWLQSFVITVFGLVVVDLYDTFGALTLTALSVVSLLFTAVYFALVERAFVSFRSLRPQFCSIYDPHYWAQERLWKAPDRYLEFFNGTPFKNVLWRLLGVRLGRRVFDDGAYLTERTLTSIGDDATLNAGSKVQCHSLEDGTFKSDRTTIGAGCTLGVGAFVHYGVTMGDGAVLAADSFLMKGEDVPSRARWGGNPARATTAGQPAGGQPGRDTSPAADKSLGETSPGDRSAGVRPAEVRPAGETTSGERLATSGR